MTATVFSKKVKGPATHAIVIGVGHYAYLPGGGGGHVVENSEDMSQLSSPPQSARELARWLIEHYESPTRPLASVRLLIAEKKSPPFSFVLPNKQKKSVMVTAATMPAAEDAILEWEALGHADPGNLLLFYFCGHGLAAGTELALLTSDFGKNPKQKLKGALDFRKFHLIMGDTAARNQCYFVDACRVGSPFLIQSAGYAGNPVVQPKPPAPNPNGELRISPIFYSTLAEARAYARPGKVSLFTEALLDSFAGAGSGDESGPWQVEVTMVQRALGKLMKQAGKILKMPQGQIPATGGDFAEVTLNTLTRPIVPVFVEVEPPNWHAQALLRCEDAAEKRTRAPRPEPWRLSVPAGKYSFFADLAANNVKVEPRIDDPVQPPLWSKPLKVVP